MILHLVIGAALSGRTTPDHAARAARRAHESARAVLWPDSCAGCGGPVLGRDALQLRGGQVVRVQAAAHLGERLYCRPVCAERQL